MAARSYAFASIPFLLLMLTPGCSSTTTTSRTVATTPSSQTTKTTTTKVAAPPSVGTTTTTGATTTGATTPTTQAPAPQAPAQPSELAISGQLVRACEMRFDNIQYAPKFDVDRSNLSDGDKARLQQLAACLSTGPLRGRTVRLVGRADMRGSDPYNGVLGSYRANAAGLYLYDLGVSSSQLFITSRGKVDATGMDQSGRANDRRVDVILQQ
jgi:peptidoglycan-associated lipoprotein